MVIKVAWCVFACFQRVMSQCLMDNTSVAQWAGVIGPAVSKLFLMYHACYSANSALILAGKLAIHVVTPKSAF